MNINKNLEMNQTKEYLINLQVNYQMKLILKIMILISKKEIKVVKV